MSSSLFGPRRIAEVVPPADDHQQAPRPKPHDPSVTAGVRRPRRTLPPSPQTVSDAIASLLAEQNQRDFFAPPRDGYARPRADQAAWDETQQEFAAWDAALRDGLGPES